MTKEIAKKTIILYILEMLEKGSSKEKPITITNITKVLNSMGVQCERRTVGRNIDYLIQYGKPIVKIVGGGCYMQTKMYGYLHGVSRDEEIRLIHEKVEVVGIKNNNMLLKMKNGKNVVIDIKEAIKYGHFTTEDQKLLVLLQSKKII